MQPLSIAIAGCGPAGLASALLLARDGHRVTLFDRLTAPAPVGSGLILQPTGLAVLAELGLLGDIQALGARIDRLFGRSVPSGRVVLDVRYRALVGERYGIAVHRAALFDTLFRAVTAARIPVETAAEIAEAPLAADGRRALATSTGRLAGPFDLLVDALGVRSPLTGAVPTTLRYGALWVNLAWPADSPFDPHTLEQRYRRASTMIGVLPIGRLAPGTPAQAALFWSLKDEDYAAWRAAGLAAWQETARAVWPDAAPLLDQISDPDHLVMARYAHHTLRSPAAAGLVHVGDAAHATSPQLGQGANMALLDAAALRIALREAHDLSEALATYVRLRRVHVWIYQALSALFTPAYQSDSTLYAWVRDWIMGPLAVLPPAPRLLASLVAGFVGAPLAALALGHDPEKRRPVFGQDHAPAKEKS